MIKLLRNSWILSSWLSFLKAHFVGLQDAADVYGEVQEDEDDEENEGEEANIDATLHANVSSLGSRCLHLRCASHCCNTLHNKDLYLRWLSLAQTWPFSRQQKSWS